MSGKWQPGDVALVRNEYNVWNVAICAVRRGRRGFVWSYGVADSESPIEADARPLVVIDPEDGEAVGRLADELVRIGIGNGLAHSTLAAALREFADPKPPKPDEPTGLGAVVRDADDRLWVRWTGTDNHLASWTRTDPSVYRTAWENVDAVEVLSEGVTP